VEQTAASKLDSEVDDVGTKLSNTDCLSAALVITVSLHVHDAIEVFVNNVNSDEDAFGKTVDLEVRSRECARQWRLCRRRSASSDGISYVSFDTLADAAMTGRSTVSIWATGPFYTRIGASIIAQLAVLRVGTLIIHSALQDGDAHSVGTHFKVRWTDAALAIGGENQSSGAVADTLVADEDKAKFCLATDANSLGIHVVAWWADTFFILIQYQSSARWAGCHRDTLDGSIALVAGDADADHSSDRKRVKHLTLGVPSTRVSHGAWVDTLPVDAGGLAWTLGIGPAANLHLGAAGALRPLKARWAGAVNFVANNCTLGWGLTGVLYAAGADAMAVVASLV